MNDDAINHPPHYTHGKMECITAIEGLGLPFHEAQVLKYITRWRHKHGLNDLRKAQWYLVRLMRLELKRLSDVGETRWDLPQGGERDACSTDTAAGD